MRMASKIVIIAVVIGALAIALYVLESTASATVKDCGKDMSECFFPELLNNCSPAKVAYIDYEYEIKGRQGEYCVILITVAVKGVSDFSNLFDVFNSEVNLGDSAVCKLPANGTPYPLPNILSSGLGLENPYAVCKGTLYNHLCKPNLTCDGMYFKGQYEPALCMYYLNNLTIDTCSAKQDTS